MRWLTNLRYRLRAVLNPGAMERELDEEMTFHLEMETRKYVEEGMAPEDARRRAEENFGPLGRQKQYTRDAWGVTLVQDVKSDVRFAGRQLRAHPLFAALAAVTLGLGIGGTVALWSVVDGLIVRPLPVADEDRLVVFWSPGDWMGMEYGFAREQVKAYDEITAFTTSSTSMRHGDSTSLLDFAAGTAELFDVLGVRPLLGRTFEPTDDLPDAEPVVVLSHGLWQREFGGDPDVVGERLVLGGAVTTVVGVMPPGFYFPFPDADAWLPLRLDPASEDYSNNGYLEILGRVRADLTPEQLDADVNALAAALGERFDYPEAWDKSRGAHVISLRELLLGDTEPALLLLLGAVVLLLLMAATNVAALLSARAADRGSEMAVRAALGAGRGRLVRQLLTETVTLGLLAGAIGMGLATAFFDVLVASLPLQRGFAAPLVLDGRSFAAAFALAFVAASLVSVAPILTVLAGRLEGHLGGERRESGGQRGGRRLQKALVFTEVVLAVTLVVGATLLIRTVARLQALDPGLDARGTLVVDLVVGPEEMGVDERRNFFAEIVEPTAALPGVRAVGLTNRLPIRDDGAQGPITIEDRPDLAGAQSPNCYYRTATPNYFRALGIELVRGRVFDDGDRADGRHVAIVSASFAERIWPGQDPIGKRVSTRVMDDGELATVVGVVEEVRLTSMTGENPLVVYRPQAQQRWPGIGRSLVLRTDLEPSSLAPAVRAAIRQSEPRAAIAGVGTMEDVVASALAEPLRIRFFLMLFAGIALVLGTVGIYGVVAYAVSRRRSEIGIRMALGAAPWKVWEEVVGSAMAPVFTGVVGGGLMAFALTRLLRGFLFEIEPNDPASFAVAAGMMLASGLAAALLPAWRAGRLDPSETLRAE